MSFNADRGNKISGIIVYCTLCILAAWGFLCVAWEIRPFWVDEWRIIYNLKFKSGKEIWGPLAYMQQFPRVYLYLLKEFTAFFEYSYQSLRILPWLWGIATIACIYSVASRIYDRATPYRLLMIMMLVSCGTFTTYLVQVKQYSMELLLSAFALWQLHYLLTLESKKANPAGYIFFCVGMLAAPFFSYTYPIVLAPVYGVVLLQNIVNWNSGAEVKMKIQQLLMQWLPLFLSTFSICIFYMIDARNTVADGNMQLYWGHLMHSGGFSLIGFCRSVFHFFAQAGSGELFWWLFGIACTAAFGAAIYRLTVQIRKWEFSFATYMLVYGVLLVLLVMGLNVAKMLPLGEPRLNAFALPAISVLLIDLLHNRVLSTGRVQWAKVICYVLLAGLTGNIYTTIVASFTNNTYARQMEIYHATEKAVTTATEQHIPILVTPTVAWPYDETRNLPFEENIPGDWVLMTWPAYRPGVSPLVYAIPDTTRLAQWTQQLPEGIARVMVGDGINYRVVNVNP